MVRRSVPGRRRPGSRLAVLTAGSAMWMAGCGGTAAAPTEASGPAPSGPPTWSGGVAELMHTRCAPCHRPGGSGPFALTTYAEAAEHADRVARAVLTREMPPWLPDSGVVAFSDERRLTEAEVAALGRWAAAGAPAGDPASAPRPPEITSEWAAGEPDLEVDFPEYAVPAEGHDLYQNLVVRIPVDETRWVRALEVRPGSNHVVHHARMMVDTTASSRELAAEDAQTGMQIMHLSGHAHDPDGFFLGWTPGKVPDQGRSDLAWRLEPGTDLVLQLHLRPSGTSQTIHPRVGFHFAATAPAQTPALILLRSRAIDILPGDSAFVVENSYRLPVAVDALSIYPHAHYVGKRLEAWAILPSGRRKDLIRISDWNFNWQDEYRYAAPPRLPAGSILTMRYVYDNSSANPRNPYEPPRRIVYGLSSTDEMAELILQVLTVDPQDRGALTRDLDRFYYQRDLRERAQDEVARARVQVHNGHLDKALDLYRQSLRARNAPDVMAEMAGVVLRQGDPATAVVIAGQAAKLSGNRDPHVLGVLARAYAAAGRTDEARELVRRAVALARQGGYTQLVDSLNALALGLGRR